MKKQLCIAFALVILCLSACALAEGTPVGVTSPGEEYISVPATTPVSFTPQPAATPVPAAAASRTVTIRRDGDVNVRSQARYDSAKIGVAKAGRTYALLDIAENGWYRIRLLDGLEGYISPKLVQGQPEAATTSRVIIRKSGNANVRKEADPASARVGVARAGRSYPLLSTAENGWYRILLGGGIVGYVSPKVVSRVSEPGENPDATPAPAADTADTGKTVTIRRQGNVNVRKEPTHDSDRVGVAIAGRRYPLLDTAENGWYHIRLGSGVEGYISSKLAK